MSDDKKIIACNYSVAFRGHLRATAKCYVLNTNPGNASERIKVLARSRSGRHIEKWEDIRRLDNFRLVTVPPQHPLYARLEPYCETPKCYSVEFLTAARERNLTR